MNFNNIVLLLKKKFKNKYKIIVIFNLILLIKERYFSFLIYIIQNNNKDKIKYNIDLIYLTLFQLFNLNVNS